MPPVGKAWYNSTQYYFYSRFHKYLPMHRSASTVLYIQVFLFLMRPNVFFGFTSYPDGLLQSGETALHVAARYGNVDVVRYLCSIQANPDLADRVSGPGHPVSCPGRSSCYGFLPVLHFPEQEQETPLHCAAWHGYSAVASALCQAGCNVDAKNREGESPLLTASARGFVDIVQCLVEHGAHLEASDKVRHNDSLYVFIYVCVCLYAYICVCVLQDGHTALHLAVRRCQVDVVRCLLDHRCYADQQDRHGNTPLHIACKDGNLTVVVAICAAGAALDLPNKVSTRISTLPTLHGLRRASLLSNSNSCRSLLCCHYCFAVSY